MAAAPAANNNAMEPVVDKRDGELIGMVDHVQNMKFVVSKLKLGLCLKLRPA